MKLCAILGAVVILVFTVSGAQGQVLRGSFGATQGAKGPPQTATGAALSSQGASIPQHPPDPSIIPQGQSQPRRESGAHVAEPEPAALKTGQGGTAIGPSASSVQVPKVLHRPPLIVAPLHPNSHFRFRRPREIIIIEVPRVVTSVVTTQAVPMLPTSGWLDTGFYGDPAANPRTREPGQLAPFDPTPQEVVERMLALAGVKKDDVVYDLGSGDGRIVVSAAKKYGVKAVGFEIDPGLAKLARENVGKQAVENLVEIRQQDFLTADLSPATVVTLYLSQDGNLALRPQLMRQLKPGARVVSYSFDMGDWQPKVVESYRDAAGDMHIMYLWEVGGPLVFSDSRR